MASSYLNDADGEDLRVPPPSHRHAAPSGPWPWMDTGDDFSEIASESSESSAEPKWETYPQNLFPNWWPGQVRKCRILEEPPHEGESKVHRIDVIEDIRPDLPRIPNFVNGGFVTVHTDALEPFWQTLQEAPFQRPVNVSMRLLFVHNMTVPLLKMLGTQYNVEPFFFSSSINWIPSRYEESPESDCDHVTITLPFVREISNLKPKPKPSRSELSSTTLAEAHSSRYSLQYDDEQIIDTQKPLSLRSSTGDGAPSIIAFDMLAVHMIRTPTTSTIISYHHPQKWKTTTAERFQSVVMLASRSVYWQKIFQRTKDPTFVLLAIMWYPLYAWDQALERLYAHISWLESQVIKTNDMGLVQQLHIIQAHLLHYASLLSDFRKSVTFIRDTPHPPLENEAHYTPLEKQESVDLMRKESQNLLSEIDRLERARGVQINRLKNVMALAFSVVNIEDSSDMRKLTQAAVRDSAAMRQISYLTMLFLPGTFAAGIFGMNITELAGNQAKGSVPHYLAVTLTLTIVTVWLVVALQSESPLHEEGVTTPLKWRLLWPYTFIRRRFRRYMGGGPSQGRKPNEGLLDRDFSAK